MWGCLLLLCLLLMIMMMSSFVGQRGTEKVIDVRCAACMMEHLFSVRHHSGGSFLLLLLCSFMSHTLHLGTVHRRLSTMG